MSANRNMKSGQKSAQLTSRRTEPSKARGKTSVIEASGKGTNLEKEVATLREELKSALKKISDQQQEIDRLNKSLGNSSGRRSTVATNNPNIKLKSRQTSGNEDYSTKTQEELVEECKKLSKKVGEMEKVMNDHGINLNKDDEEENGEENEETFTFTHTTRTYVPNFEKVFSSIDDLNIMATEPQIVHTKSGATFKQCDLINLTLYKDGMEVENSPFRQYSSTSVQEFFQDIEDGYYPTELKGDYPQGVVFKVIDNRHKTYLESQGFYGKGQRLGGSKATETEECNETPKKIYVYERKMEVTTRKTTPKEEEASTSGTKPKSTGTKPKSIGETNEVGMSELPVTSETLEVPPTPPPTPVSNFDPAQGGEGSVSGLPTPEIPTPAVVPHTSSVPLPPPPNVSTGRSQSGGWNVDDRQPKIETESEFSFKPAQRTTYEQARPGSSREDASRIRIEEVTNEIKRKPVSSIKKGTVKEDSPVQRKESLAQRRQAGPGIRINDEESTRSIDSERADKQKNAAPKESTSAAPPVEIIATDSSDRLVVNLPKADRKGQVSADKKGQDEKPYNITNINYREGNININVTSEEAAKLIPGLRPRDEDTGDRDPYGGGPSAGCKINIGGGKIRSDDPESCGKGNMKFADATKKSCDGHCNCGCQKTLQDLSDEDIFYQTSQQNRMQSEYGEKYNVTPAIWNKFKEEERYMRVQVKPESEDVNEYAPKGKGIYVSSDYAKKYDESARNIEEYLRNNPPPPQPPSDDEEDDDDKEDGGKKKKKKSIDTEVTYEHFQYIGVDLDEEGEEGEDEEQDEVNEGEFFKGNRRSSDDDDDSDD